MFRRCRTGNRQVKSWARNGREVATCTKDVVRDTVTPYEGLPPTQRGTSTSSSNGCREVCGRAEISAFVVVARERLERPDTGRMADDATGSGTIVPVTHESSQRSAPARHIGSHRPEDHASPALAWMIRASMLATLVAVVGALLGYMVLFLTALGVFGAGAVAVGVLAFRDARQRRKTRMRALQDGLLAAVRWFTDFL